MVRFDLSKTGQSNTVVPCRKQNKVVLLCLVENGQRNAFVKSGCSDPGRSDVLIVEKSFFCIRKI